MWPFKRNRPHGDVVDKFIECVENEEHVGKTYLTDLSKGAGLLEYDNVSLLCSLDATVFLVHNCHLPVCAADERKLRACFHRCLASIARTRLNRSC